MNKHIGSKYSDEITYVNLSSSFMARTRCKFCGRGPEIYYYIRNKGRYLDPKEINRFIEWFRKHKYRICSDSYLYGNPSDFRQMSVFNYTIPNKSYDPTLHRVIGINEFFDYMDYIICPCGKSRWKFYYSAAKNRLDIIKRKCRNFYPKKFVF